MPSPSSVSLLLFVTLALGATADEQPATLHVRWSGAPAGNVPVSLLPVDAALPGGLSRQEAIARWTRPVAADGQTWSALPHGTYRIVVREGVPREVAEVVLAPGEERVIELSLPEPRGVPAAPPLRVFVPEAADGARRTSATIWSNGTARAVIPTVEGVTGGTLLTFAGGCIAGGTFVLASPSQVAATSLDGTCTEIVNPVLARRATLAARFTVSRTAQLPRSGAVRLADCDAAVALLPFAIADGRAEVSLPAGCRAAALHFADFAPVWLTRRLLAAGDVHDAGTIALVKGAAAVVRVRSARDGRPLAGIRVSAVRAGELALMRDPFAGDTAAIATGVTDAAGWVRLSGLPGEKFVLALRDSARRHPQISEPYRIDPGGEAVLDDLSLDPPSTLLVTVALPDDLRDAVTVRRVELLPAGHNHWPARVPLTGNLTSTGAVVEDVPAGTWKVRALGRLQNGFSTELGSAIVDLAAGADGFVTIAVTDRVYRGRVTRDGAAVTGTLNVKSVERGGGGRHGVATLAHDGTFEVLLDRRGDYTATVQEASGTMSKLGRYVTFDDPELEVEIELPAGRIEGRVVDGAGVPVSGAGVSATQQLPGDPPALFGTRSGEDGRFVLDSISAGTWELVARTSDGKSEPAVVTFDSAAVDGITLLLDPTRTVAIRVLDATGHPLRDAFVNVELPPRTEGRSRNNLTTTDADGVAEVQVSSRDRSAPANVIVATPDLRLSCALLRLDADHTITVTASTGEVRLIRREWRAIHDIHPRLVASSGCSIPFLGARTEPDARGGSAKVMPPIAAGTWRYIEARGAEQLAALLTGQSERLTAIETFTIDTRTVTRVVLDQQ